MVALKPLLAFFLSIIFFELLQKAAGVSQIVESETVITAFKKNVEEFNKNFDENFRDLQSFIQANLSLADTLDIIYLLFTPENKDSPYTLNATQKSLQESKFNPKLGVKFLLHGYGVALVYPKNVLFLIKDKLLEQGDYNVIVVNYTKYANDEFSTSVKYSYLVARNIGNMIQFLMQKTGISSENFHLIGHSLGGEVVGIVGNMVPNIGRITGMDPGGPIYRNFPPNYRINDKSANFVDVIHTSAAKKFPEGLGIDFPVGQQDFFPNGGNYQAGCNYGKIWLNEQQEDEMIRSKLSLLKCSHIRSEFLFATSVLDCQFIGVLCNSYEDFNSGKCNANNSKTAEMGFPAKKIPGLPPKTKFYLNTTATYPYCKEKDNEGFLTKLWNSMMGLS